ncbi:MAG: ImmA/IrrE family metallo-endopeptidase [Acidobacteriota bacterium]|nr:MAG: ImmA/IrrE family metallo-endopeptidase [Acidobacteriota bacterium]
MPNEHPEAPRPIPFPFDDLDAARTQALARCRTLIERARAAHPDWQPPPFDPRVYARVLDIPITMSRELDRWDALLIPLGNTFKIVCNANVHSAGRRRFSIAHELGHTFFDNTLATYQMRTSQNRAQHYPTDAALQLERLCDLCAAELLMPEASFREAVERTGFRAGAIPELARSFGVSLEAAALRFVQTSDRCCAAGFFEFSEPPRRRRCAVRPLPLETAYRARRVFRGCGFPFLFPDGKSIDDASVIVRASLQPHELTATEVFTLGSTTMRLRVSAIPLHRGDFVMDPPTVCVVLESGADC